MADETRKANPVASGVDAGGAGNGHAAPAANERLPVRIGGLMRCCTGTLAEYGGPEDEGTVLPCKWCSSSMIVRDGAWEWNRDA